MPLRCRGPSRLAGWLETSRVLRPGGGSKLPVTCCTVQSDHSRAARLLWSAFAAPLPAGRRAASSAARDMPPCAHSAPSQRAASRSVLRAAPPRAPSRAASGLAHARSAVSARSSWLAAAGGGVRSGCQRFRCCQPAASGDAPAARFAAGGPQSKRSRLCPPASGQKDAARRGASAELQFISTGCFR